MLTSDDWIKLQKEWNERVQKEWEKRNPEEVQRRAAEKHYRNQQRLQGKIYNEFTRQWLEGEIAASRTALIIGMVLTALIKGQVFIWAIMYVAYRGRVKAARKKALDEDWED